MSVIIKPKEQLKRIEILFQYLNKIKEVESGLLSKRPRAKAWAPAEVIKHMTIAHKVYEPKIQRALKSNKSLGEATGLKCSSIPSYLIKRFPPKGEQNEIKFKMKTFKRFKPTLNLKSSDPNEVIREFSNCLSTLKNWIIDYSEDKTPLIKFNSAIGPLVRFNIPEACEFILCHNERHFQQIENTLISLSKEN